MSGYLEETGHRSRFIDCYWEADVPATVSRYPSLPEPFFNVYVPIGAGERPSIKGLSCAPGVIEVAPRLFGVRMSLRGFMQLRVASCESVNGRIAPCDEILSPEHAAFFRELGRADDFEARINRVRSFLDAALERPLRPAQSRIAEAFDFVTTHYRDPAVVRTCARTLGRSERTLLNWFRKTVSINPKLLTRIARFHRALSLLHLEKESGYYLDCGYYDQAHFIREFREFAGQSPEQYRRTIAEQYGAG